MHNCLRMFRSHNIFPSLFLESLSKYMTRALIICPFILVLISCASAPPAPPSYELTYQHLPRLQIAAGSIVLKSAYKPDEAENHIDTKKPQNPTMVVRQWVNDRLEIQSGSYAKLVLTVIDGRVIRTEEANQSTFGFLASKNRFFLLIWWWMWLSTPLNRKLIRDCGVICVLKSCQIRPFLGLIA